MIGGFRVQTITQQQFLAWVVSAVITVNAPANIAARANTITKAG